MKKFIIAVCVAVLLLFIGNAAYYRLGLYVNWKDAEAVTAFVKTEGDAILMERDGIYEPFEIRGIDMGSGMPGHWSTDFAIDKEAYKRWFAWIQELGANTIRIYTIHHDDFYDAFYEYNEGREEPLYLLQGVWMNDGRLNSHRDAYDDELFQTLKEDCRTVVDILHGKRSISLGYDGKGSGVYRRDVSQWVIGYIIGVEWENSIVVYTNQLREDRAGFQGEYLYTAPEATPFEAMLCEAGDAIIAYEAERYSQQKLIAFANWPVTDPFAYPVSTAIYFSKMAAVNVEHIKATEKLLSGQFASYHVYSYFPDYLEVMREMEQYPEEEQIEKLGKMRYANTEYRLSLLNAPPIEAYVKEADYYDSQGRVNTYLAYLKALNRFHTMPVVISEYGITTGRGMAQVDNNTDRNQGYMSEQEQGHALVQCYQDIMAAGSAGSCLFSWQDEWFKRTWNTFFAVDRDKISYWSDYQTNEQFFGLLTFDAGAERSVCYVDGDISEWTEEDLLLSAEKMDLSMKYDERFLYFLVRRENFNAQEDVLYLPIDTTQKSGSTYCEAYDVSFERPADFLLMIDGRENSRLLVQERYDVIYAVYGEEYYAENPYFNPPEKDSSLFRPVYMALKRENLLPEANPHLPVGEKYETGLLRYGNANPQSADFDSLSDFIFFGDYVEIRIPWLLLNFSNPSEMQIHDDYYEHYGIEDITLKEISVGSGLGEDREYPVPMASRPMEGWGHKVTYHERLKESYYILQDYWAGLE